MIADHRGGRGLVAADLDARGRRAHAVRRDAPCSSPATARAAARPPARRATRAAGPAWRRRRRAASAQFNANRGRGTRDEHRAARIRTQESNAGRRFATVLAWRALRRARARRDRSRDHRAALRGRAPSARRHRGARAPLLAGSQAPRSTGSSGSRSSSATPRGSTTRSSAGRSRRSPSCASPARRRSTRSPASPRASRRCRPCSRRPATRRARLDPRQGRRRPQARRRRSPPQRARDRDEDADGARHLRACRSADLRPRAAELKRDRAGRVGLERARAGAPLSSSVPETTRQLGVGGAVRERPDVLQDEAAAPAPERAADALEADEGRALVGRVGHQPLRRRGALDVAAEGLPDERLGELGDPGALVERRLDPGRRS